MAIKAEIEGPARDELKEEEPLLKSHFCLDSKKLGS